MYAQYWGSGEDSGFLWLENRTRASTESKAGARRCKVKGPAYGGKDGQTLTLKFVGSLNTVRMLSACACISTSCISPGSTSFSLDLVAGCFSGFSVRAALRAVLFACWEDAESVEAMVEEVQLAIFICNLSGVSDFPLSVSPWTRFKPSSSLQRSDPWRLPSPVGCLASAPPHSLTPPTVTPFDVVKTRLQTQPKEPLFPRPPPNKCCQPSSVSCVRNISSLARPLEEVVCVYDHGMLRRERVNGFLDAVRHVWRVEGLRGLWKGAATSL